MSATNNMEKFDHKKGLRNPEIELAKRWQAANLEEVKGKLAEICDAFLNEAARLKKERELLGKIERPDDITSSASGPDGGETYTQKDVEAQRARIRKIEDQVRLLEDYIVTQKSFVARTEENIRWLKTWEEEFKKRLLAGPSQTDLLDTNGQNN